MKAYVIDPARRVVEAVDYRDHRDISRAVSAPGMDDPFCLGALLDRGHTMYVNDNGLNYPSFSFFAISGGHQPYAGNGFVVGREMRPTSAQTADPSWTLEDVIARVQWLTRAQAMVYLR